MSVAPAIVLSITRGGGYEISSITALLKVPHCMVLLILKVPLFIRGYLCNIISLLFTRHLVGAAFKMSFLRI